MTNVENAHALSNLVAAGLSGISDRRTLLKLAGGAAAATGLIAVSPHGASHAGAQAEDNIFIHAAEQDISSLDPHTGNDYAIVWGQRAVYDGLMRFEGNPIELKPLVAKNVSSSEDAITWTIEIDDRAVFQDGSRIDAEVVQWNFNRLLSKNKGNAWMFAEIMNEDSLTVVDDLTLQIELLKPFAPFDLILPWLFIANPVLVEEHAGDDEGESWLRENSAGSGPYTIARFEPGNLYQFERDPDYWYTVEGAGPLVDTFVWRIIRESSSKRIALETGEIQYCQNLSIEDTQALEDDDRFLINYQASFDPFQLKLNNQLGPTSDVNVRRALTSLFDYEAAAESIAGRGELLRGPLPESLDPWFNEDLPGFTFDMDAAREHLSASAYPDGFDIEFVYITGLDVEETFGLILLEKAAELGINVMLTPLVWPDMVARAASPETMPGILCVYASTNYLDPDNYLWGQYHSSQAGSSALAASWFQNDEFDALLEQGRSTVDQAERKSIYDTAQQMLVDNAVDIWVYSEARNDAWIKELGERAFMDAGGGDIRQISYSHPD